MDELYDSCAVLAGDLCRRIDRTVGAELETHQDDPKLNSLFRSIGHSTDAETAELIEDEFSFAVDQNDSEGLTTAQLLDEALEQIQLRGDLSAETWENVLSAIQRWCERHSN